MKLVIALILAASTANAEPRVVEIPEIADAFYPIPLTKVRWAKQSSEGKIARQLCGGDFDFIGAKKVNGQLIHIAECK